MGKLSENDIMQKWTKTVKVGYNASGAVEAARNRDVVVIVDLIDMSTTAEAVLDDGARLVLGAALDTANPPVRVNPEEIGYFAGVKAIEYNTEVIIVSEPRWSTVGERLQYCQKTLCGLKRSGISCKNILPNIGGEISKLTDFADKVVIIVSDTGGVAFDAAYTNGARAVLTATICRTRKQKGVSPAETGVKRAIEAAVQHRTGITFIAASANSYEDVLGAEFLAKKVIESGFLNE